jgi:uncharacterized membrane protein YphA (DoxX/SURF4 family)
MKIHEPIGDASYGALYIRVVLGLYFVLAGLLKLNDPPGFVAEVHQLAVIPPHIGTVYGILLPYVEVVAGGLLIAGLWTTLASLCTTLMLLSFVVAFGIRPAGTPLFNKDIILLAASLSLMYTGCGAWGIDRFRRADG